MTTMIPSEVDDFNTEGEKRFYELLHTVAKPEEKYTCWYNPDIEGREPTLFCFAMRSVRNAGGERMMSGKRIHLAQTDTRIVEALRKDVLALTSYGERQVGSEGHRAAKEYLIQRMEQVSLKPYWGDSFELPYTQLGTQFNNLVGHVPGAAEDLAPILVGAHYDTCGPIPGADDNASALAIALLVVEKLQSVTLARDVIVAFFDAEEPPHFMTRAMGSINFYNSQRTEEIACAVILDLMGHDVPITGFEDLLFITGIESHSELENVIKETRVNDRIRIVPTLNKYVGDMSDQHIFRVNGVPYLFLSCGRWEHYHMPTDTPEKLNYAKMEAMADYLHNLIVRCDEADFLKGSSDYDSTSTELQYMNSVFSKLFLKYGFAGLQTREDINTVVRKLMSAFRL